MTISIADLKKKQSFLDKIKTKIDQTSSGGNRDPRFWAPTFDKETGGGAVIRFLPSADLNEVPFVEYITHYFKGPTGQSYSEKSLVSIGQPDPIADVNRRLYATGIQSNKDQASAQKRRKKFIANILVVKDNANPDNNGKVFLYEFGPAIWGKMEGVMFPQLPGEEPIDVFNPFEGANFFIKIKPQALGTNIVPNYADSHFGAEPTEIKGDIETIINQTHSLKEFVAPDKFKSYDELCKRLIEVLGYTTGTGLETVIGYEDTSSAPQIKPKAEVKLTEDEDTPSIASYTEDEDDEDVAALKALLQD